MITTQQAADKLGLSLRRVQALITAGRLPASKVGRDWLIRPQDLAGLVIHPHGRPRKTK